MRGLWKLWSLLYFLLLIYVVFFARRRPQPSWNPKQWSFHWIPFQEKWQLYTHSHDVSGVYLDIVGNIIMFAPLPLFLYIVFSVRRYSILLTSAFVLSLCIETVQYVTGIGFADVDDIIFNTLGGALGVLLIDGIRTASQADSYA